MSGRVRATVPARQQQPELLSAKDLEAIRCAWRSGLHEPVVGVLLDQIAIRDHAIHTIARQTAAGGTPEQQAAARVAEEMIDPQAPVHFRLEFDYVVPPSIGAAAALAEIAEWSLDLVVNLAVTGRVTVTYRGSSESWETRLP